MSQKFCHILVVHASLWYIYNVTNDVTVIGSFVVVGALTHHELIHSAYDLKAAQMNLLSSLIWKFMLYMFKLSHNTVEVLYTHNHNDIDNNGTTNTYSNIVKYTTQMHVPVKTGGQSFRYKWFY